MQRGRSGAAFGRARWCVAGRAGAGGGGGCLCGRVFFTLERVLLRCGFDLRFGLHLGRRCFLRQTDNRIGCLSRSRSRLRGCQLHTAAAHLHKWDPDALALQWEPSWPRPSCSSFPSSSASLFVAQEACGTRTSAYVGCTSASSSSVVDSVQGSPKLKYASWHSLPQGAGAAPRAASGAAQKTVLESGTG